MSYIYNGDNSLRVDYYDAPVLDAPMLSAGGNLSPNTTYYYKVMGCDYVYLNLVSSLILGAWSNTVSIMTTGSDKTIDLSWSDIGASYYFVMRSLTGNFDDAEDFFLSNHGTYIKQDITTNSYSDDGSFSYIYRYLIRQNGIPKLSILSDTKTPKDLYDFIITTPCSGMVDLYWAVPNSETTIAPFTDNYQPFIYRFDFNFYIYGGIFEIKEKLVIIRGFLYNQQTGTLNIGKKASSGMTSEGGFLFLCHSYFNSYLRGAMNIYDSVIWDIGNVMVPQPSGLNNYEKYKLQTTRNLLCYDPSEFIDSEWKQANRLYFNPTEASGGSALLKNFKIEDGEYEQYYDQVTVESLITEGRIWGQWIYYDECKAYNLESYDKSYDLGIHMGDASGRDNYVELVNPNFQAKGQADNSDPYIYIYYTYAQDKWMRIYYELDIKVVDENDTAVSGALVYILTNDGIEYQVYTNADGEIDTQEIRKGKYTFNPDGSNRTGYLSALVSSGYVIESAGNPVYIKISKTGHVPYKGYVSIKRKSQWDIVLPTVNSLQSRKITTLKLKKKKLI